SARLTGSPRAAAPSGSSSWSSSTSASLSSSSRSVSVPGAVSGVSSAPPITGQMGAPLRRSPIAVRPVSGWVGSIGSGMVRTPVAGSVNAARCARAGMKKPASVGGSSAGAVSCCSRSASAAPTRIRSSRRATASARVRSARPAGTGTRNAARRSRPRAHRRRGRGSARSPSTRRPLPVVVSAGVGAAPGLDLGDEVLERQSAVFVPPPLELFRGPSFGAGVRTGEQRLGVHPAGSGLVGDEVAAGRILGLLVGAGDVELVLLAGDLGEAAPVARRPVLGKVRLAPDRLDRAALHFGRSLLPAVALFLDEPRHLGVLRVFALAASPLGIGLVGIDPDLGRRRLGGL